MASQLHFDKKLASGYLSQPPPFRDASRVALVDNGVGIFLQVGAAGCSDAELTSIAIDVLSARELVLGLNTALGNLGE